MAIDEIALAAYPIVQESVAHNTRALSNIRTLSSAILGLCAGLLHLESQWGFGFYLIGNLFITALVFFGPLERSPSKYLQTSSTPSDPSENKGGGIGAFFAVLNAGGVLGVESIMGFVLFWTIGFAVVEG